MYRLVFADKAKPLYEIDNRCATNRPLIQVIPFLFPREQTRAEGGDFNSCVDIVIIFQMSCLLSFSFILQDKPVTDIRISFGDIL